MVCVCVCCVMTIVVNIEMFCFIAAIWRTLTITNKPLNVMFYNLNYKN